MIHLEIKFMMKILWHCWVTTSLNRHRDFPFVELVAFCSNISYLNQALDLVCSDGLILLSFTLISLFLYLLLCLLVLDVFKPPWNSLHWFSFLLEGEVSLYHGEPFLDIWIGYIYINVRVWKPQLCLAKATPLFTDEAKLFVFLVRLNFIGLENWFSLSECFVLLVKVDGFYLYLTGIAVVVELEISFTVYISTLVFIIVKAAWFHRSLIHGAWFLVRCNSSIWKLSHTMWLLVLLHYLLSALSVYGVTFKYPLGRWFGNHWWMNRSFGLTLISPFEWLECIYGIKAVAAHKCISYCLLPCKNLCKYKYLIAWSNRNLSFYFIC